MRSRFSIRAAALPLVLWAIFVLTTVVVVVLGLVDFDLDLETAGAKRFTARNISLTGVAYATHPQIKRGDPLLFHKFPDGSELYVQIQNENARLNINSLLQGDTAPLRDLFKFWGLDDRQSSMLADSLKDWVDADEFRSLNGAEAGDLAPDSGSSRPENRPFLVVSEMKRVRGMEALEQVKPDWEDYFSVRSSGRLDLQDVSPDLLQVFGGLSRDQALEVVKYRNGPDGRAATEDDRPIAGAEAVAAIVPLGQTQLAHLNSRFGAGGETRRIVSQGTCGGLHHVISAVAVAGGGKFMEWSEK